MYVCASGIKRSWKTEMTTDYKFVTLSLTFVLHYPQMYSFESLYHKDSLTLSAWAQISIEIQRITDSADF